MYESNDKMVSHPDHYKSETGLEVIDVIEAFTFDLKGAEATDTGNILKYICRWKKKNGLQDLEKAMWYLQHLIDHVESLKNEECLDQCDEYSIVSIDDETDLENVNIVLRNVPGSKIIKYRKGFGLYIPKQKERKINGGN